MSKTLQILFLIFICSTQLYSAEPLVKFYLQDGSTKQYNISEIENFKFIISNFSYRMEVWFRGSLVYSDTKKIDSILFEGNKMKTVIGNNYSMNSIYEVDSIIFVANSCYEIQIGTQTWMCHNLDVDHYRNGDSIPEVRDPEIWKNLKTGAWCYYNNNADLGKIYGKLYNWYAVNDPRGLAPKGWLVPGDSEWVELTRFLGGDSIAGGKMKMNDFKYWAYPNTGATNSSGFSSLPGGLRFSDDDSFFGIGNIDLLWSSTDEYSWFAWGRGLGYNDASIERRIDYKASGLSVRCLKD